MRIVLPAVLSGVLVLGGCGGGESSAACAQPETSVSPSSARPGDDVTVSAAYLLDGCDDSNQERSPARPLHDVDVVWQQGERQARLTRVDADASGRATVTVTIPRDASAGSAWIAVGTAGRAPVTVRER